ncbi:MAG: hypothetical protein ACRCZF_07895 [Gemmataceae bacterium]
MIFADEVFWKTPNVYDLIGAIGLPIALISIWYAWYLSRRDIRRYVAATLARLASIELLDATQMLESARRAVEANDIPTARQQLDLSSDKLGTFLGGQRAAVSDLEQLQQTLSGMRKLSIDLMLYDAKPTDAKKRKLLANLNELLGTIQSVRGAMLYKDGLHGS